jgi:NADH dehydrogenase
MSGEIPRVVVVGGGFGGLEAAKALRHAPADVTLCDRNNYHLFQPLLYQVATGGLAPGEIAAPIRRVVRGQANTSVLLENVDNIDLERREVVHGDGTIPYDYLIVATGARHAYFGHEDWEAAAPGLKTIEDALDIRRRIYLAYEEAERCPDPDRLPGLLDFVVIGGGPTGVELAGAIAEIARRTLRRDFRRIDPTASRVILIEAGSRVLPSFPPDLGRRAQATLEAMGVEVRLGTAVSDVSPEGVRLGDEWIGSRTIIWAAGVEASPLGRSLGQPADRAGRIEVLPDLSLPGHPEVFIVGDLALARGANGAVMPGLAPVAMQEGRLAARNVIRRIAGQPTQPFVYHDRGALATIGRRAAVAEIRGLRLTGVLAWLTWLFVHILYLIGFDNRIAVLWHWAYAYVTFERADRLITETRRQGALR